jgi:hypothetical protein
MVDKRRGYLRGCKRKETVRRMGQMREALRGCKRKEAATARNMAKEERGLEEDLGASVGRTQEGKGYEANRKKEDRRVEVGSLL